MITVIFLHEAADYILADNYLPKVTGNLLVNMINLLTTCHPNFWTTQF